MTGKRTAPRAKGVARASPRRVLAVPLATTAKAGPAAEERCGLAVVGGGLTGLTVFLEARRRGRTDTVLIETDAFLGGRLAPVLHPGCERPEAREAARLAGEAGEDGVWLGTTVLAVGEDRSLTCVSERRGMVTLRFDRCVLATGGVERTRGMLKLPGTRPARLFTEGMARRFLFLQRALPGEAAVVVAHDWSGVDLGRALAAAGAREVHLVMPAGREAAVEAEAARRPWKVNPVLHRSADVLRIAGNWMLEGVDVREDGRDAALPCDAFILAAGRVPGTTLAVRSKLPLGTPPVLLEAGVEADGTGKTPRDGVWAGGDCVRADRGAAEVLEAARALAGAVCG